MQHRTPSINVHGLTLVLVAGAWIAGILFAYAVQVPVLALLVGASAALLFLFPLWHVTQYRLIMLLIACLLLGAYRYTLVSPKSDPHAVSRYVNNNVTLQGTVADEPKVQGRGRTLVISVTKLLEDGTTSWQDVDGQLSVQTLGTLIEDLYGANYGDSVEIQGKLQTLQSPSAPNIFASMAFPRITVHQNEGNPIIAFFYSLRVRLATIIEQSLPQPYAALLIAILLSLHTPALKPLIPAFNATGCAHLIAPSGFKVTIMAGLIITSTRRLYEKQKSAGKLLPAQRRGNWRQGLVTLCVLLAIFAFTLLSGAGSAALRAGIMGALLVIAPRIGRVYNIYSALALAALLLSIADPFVLWDSGFLLSFIGTLGIVLLSPFFQFYLRFLSQFPFGGHITEVLAATLAAITATLPLVAVDFHEVSFIAPLTNILTVPLLGLLLVLGIVLCIAGLLFLPLATLIGYVAWPFLFYVKTVILWSFNVPYAYLSVGTLDAGISWLYYAFLLLGIYGIQQRLKLTALTMEHVPLFSWSKRTRLLLQCGIALLIIAATGTTAFATQPDGRLTITFLAVGPSQQPSQGEAILIRTPDGKTVLIDGGPDATSLSQELDSRLPSWQRTINAVILTSPRAEHLAGLQDIVSRYAIDEVIDAGMLHPSAAYALWRRTIRERALHYLSVTQGVTLHIGTQVMLQILWPPTPLHKGVDEIRDNSLVVRILTTNFSLLLLGAAAQSQYALAGLMTTIPLNHLRASIVQVIGEDHKPFPTELMGVLQLVRPSLLVITPGALSAKARKQGQTSIIALPPELAQRNALLRLQVMQTAQVGMLEIDSSGGDWSIHTT